MPKESDTTTTEKIMSMLLGKVRRVSCEGVGVKERGEELEKKFVQLEIMMSNKEIEMIFVRLFLFVLPVSTDIDRQLRVYRNEILEKYIYVYSSASLIDRNFAMQTPNVFP